MKLYGDIRSWLFHPGVWPSGGGGDAQAAGGKVSDSSADSPAQPMSHEGLPDWVLGLLPSMAQAEAMPVEDGLSLHRGEGLLLASVRFDDAAAMAPQQLAAATATGYQRLLEHLVRPGHQPLHPWRFWNLVPDICVADEQGLHPYMHFNAGRYEGLSRHYLGASTGQTESDRRRAMHRLEEHIVAASAVDMGTRDLRIHMLAGASPAMPIENPRQVAAYHYSQRYGPLPPCFARAVRVHHRGCPMLIISGTASIVGEDSTHRTQLQAQMLEVIANIQALLAQATGHAGEAPQARRRARIRHLRVYLASLADVAVVTQMLRSHLSAEAELAFGRADLCRPELLVEIEALVALPVSADHVPPDPSSFSQGS